ncbi:MFS transporter [Afifella pfennigii]|uniref:MFS transporter n=1 Tax=Afifella pfennigii TaxID=209897 RepID=UPI00069189DA|nr:MFS transporter [Afifella pfennigii]
MTLSALIVMLVTQAAVVAASLAVPVLAPQMTEALHFRPELVGYYTSLVFIGALISGQMAPRFIASHGSVRLSQALAAIAALALLVSGTGTLAGIALGALLIGFAYGPGNPASSSLLLAVTPPSRRGFLFSIKQTAVPIGGATAGILLPFLAARFGWNVALFAMAGICLALALAVQPWRARLDAHRTGLAAASPLTPLRLIAREPSLRLLAVVAACLASIQFALSAVFVTFLVGTSDAGLHRAGIAFSLAMAASIALRIGLGALADRLGGGPVLRATALVMTAAALICALAAGGVLQLGFLPLAASLIVLATGAFSWNGVYLAEVAATAEPSEVGAATAGTMTFVFLGGIFGPGLFASATMLVGAYWGGFAFAATLAGTATLLLTRLAARPLPQAN